MENKNVENLDENVKTEKKKSPVGLIILVVVLMIGCLVGGYFINEAGVFTSSKDKEEKEEKKEEDKKEEKEEQEKEETIEIESDLVKKLDRNITTAGAPYYGGFYELFTDKKMTANDLSDDAKGKVIMLRLYEKTGNDSFLKWEGTTYTKAEIEEMFKSVFGSNVLIKHMDIGQCPTLSYDSTTEKYTVGGSACGGTTGPYHTRHKVVAAVKKENELTLSIRVVFSDGLKFYSDYTKTNVVEEDKDENGSPTITDFSKGTLYKAVFKLENDNYGLSYVEPIK